MNVLTSFERFCVERSLILIAQLHQWKDDYPGASFEEILIRNWNVLNEAAWLDELHQLSENTQNVEECFTPLALPLHKGMVSGEANGLTKKWRLSRTSTNTSTNEYLIIQCYINVWVVVIINPFLISKILSELETLYPVRKYRFLCVAPRVYSELLGMEVCSVTDTDLGCLTLEYPEGRVEFNKSIIPIIDIISEDVFDARYCKVLKEPQAILLERTAMCAWVLTSKPFDEELRSRLVQELGRYIYCITMTENRFDRLVKLTSLYHLESQKIDIEYRSRPLNVNSWKSVNFQDEAQCMNFLLGAAIDCKASDIHLEPKEDRVRIRFRIDGRLYEQNPFPKAIYQSLISRVKIIGGMRLDIVGQAQDGSGMFWKNDQRYDLRFSITIVDNEVETAVIRILYNELPRLSDLGLSQSERSMIDWAIGQESGMIVLTGPTGSGKTTTLYALLNVLNNPEVSIVTIEQPIEKHFPDAKQISVFNEGFTFASALRSVLRQDPDIIMLGEVRDMETCRTAIQAALTGHLVLTTTHTLDAVGVIERFCGSFQTDPIALSIALRLVVAQRLTRVPCSCCKTLRRVERKELGLYSNDLESRDDWQQAFIAENKGCNHCHYTGSQGRRLISELMPVDSNVRNYIASRVHPDQINEYLRKCGFASLLEQAMKRLTSEELALSEVQRLMSVPKLKFLDSVEVGLNKIK